MLPAVAAVSSAVAELVAACVAEPHPVIGLATGATMASVDDALIARHRRGLSLAGVTAFLLDEYLGLPLGDERSFRSEVQRRLVEPTDLPAERVAAPPVERPDRAGIGPSYEAQIRAAGGIDLQLLGIGRNGHIGFNEPGSSPTSRTRVVDLTPSTRAANGLDRMADGPRQAVTMGLGTILEARSIVLVATGAHKAETVARAVAGPVDPSCPASVLQQHPRCQVVLDASAAAGLAP